MGRGSSLSPTGQAQLRAVALRSEPEPLSGARLIAAIGSSDLHPDSAAAWADLGSDGHETIQHALRTRPFGWREDVVLLAAEHDDEEEVELPLGMLVDELDSAIAAQVLPQEALVHRGVRDLRWLLDDAACDDPRQLIGRRVRERGYLATSASEQVAWSWGMDAVIDLQLPAGTPVLSLPAHGYVEQDELLLARDSELRFTSARRSDAGRWHLHARLCD